MGSRRTGARRNGTRHTGTQGFAPPLSVTVAGSRRLAPNGNHGRFILLPLESELPSVAE